MFRVNTLGGKPAEAGHPFFLKVGVWTGSGAQSAIWIPRKRGNECREKLTIFRKQLERDQSK